jgi:2-C-methyl-D-erythritol 4-phosphate cytidylyltransferase
MAVALIVAAGRGERLGLDRPKALVNIAGRAMLEWSVAELRRVPEVGEIVVALPAELVGAAPEGTTAVAGGAVRTESVSAALAAAGAGDPVIVHDAARPLARAELFAAALAELDRADADAVVCAAPVADTIKQVGDDGRTVTRTLDRSRLWAVQTPQAFRRAALEGSLAGASAETLRAATDEAWLVERSGGRVVVLPAPPENFKITTAADLRVAELLLSERVR